MHFLQARKCSKDELVEAVRISDSVNECLLRLFGSKSKKNLKEFHLQISLHNIDISHLRHSTYNPKGYKEKGYYQRPIPKDWHTARKTVIEERGYVCEECGHVPPKILTLPTQALHIHHIDCNYLNNNKNNLQILCSNCHIKVHKILVAKARAP
jgi:5-methylcytosine-specific restriction endonuclease McrA